MDNKNIITSEYCLVVASNSSSLLCLTSKQSRVFHIGFHSLWAPSHEIITVVHTYSVHSKVHIHTVCTCILRGDMCIMHTRQQRYRFSYLCPSVNVQCVANCLNVWLLQWNMSEKLIMWHQSETHYELWMNFTLVDEILPCEFSENNTVYRDGGSLGCLSVILKALQWFHYNFSITVQLTLMYQLKSQWKHCDEFMLDLWCCVSHTHDNWSGKYVCQLTPVITLMSVQNKATSCSIYSLNYNDFSNIHTDRRAQLLLLSECVPQSIQCML